MAQKFKSDVKTGFPSEHVDPYIKRGKDWCMAYTRASHEQSDRGFASNLFKNSASKYKEWRQLARGEQDVSKYYPVLGIKNKNGGVLNKSWRALDMSILPIGIKFKELLIGKVLNRDNDITVKSIDPASAEEERQLKNKLKESVINKGAIGELEQMGYQQKPSIDDGTPMPETLGEVDDVVKLFAKDEYAIEVKDAIKWYDTVNDKDQVDMEIAEDLIETGIGVKRIDMDATRGTIKYRRCVPERCIANYFVKTDGSDIYRFGEYIDMDISQLKQWWPGQKESVYREVSEISNNNKYDYPGPGTTNLEGYPWDKDKITVLDNVWFSTDTIVHLVKPDENGNPRVFKQDYRFPNQNRGEDDEVITDEQYQERYQNRRIIRTQIRNIYKCKWIVGTKYCFDYGLSTNMPRVVTDYQETKLPYVLHTTGFKSLIKRIETVLDNAQINWLQFQNHIAKSRPAGLSIEMSALENITLGKNKGRLQPKEVLRMLYETGILVWRRKQYNAASNQFKPIEELKNSLSDAAERHLNFITADINLLRDILGINEVEDASTPNPDILKGVAEIAAQGTNNALTTLYKSFDSISVRSAKMMADLTPDVGRFSESFRNVLGARSQEFWNNLTLKEMGIYFEPGSDQKAIMRIHEYAKIAEQKQEITLDHLLEIENEPNVMKKAQILKQRRKEYMKEVQLMQQQNLEGQKQANMQEMEMSLNTEIKKLEKKGEQDLNIEKLRGSNELRIAQLEIIKIKLQKDIDLTLQEKELVGELMKIDKTKQWDLKIAKARPKPTVSSNKK